MDDAKTVKRAALRRAVLYLFVSVIALDSVALGGYYLADVQHANPKIRLYYTVAWTVASALVVAFMLKRVRKARFRNY